MHWKCIGIIYWFSLITNDTHTLLTEMKETFVVTFLFSVEVKCVGPNERFGKGRQSLSVLVSSFEVHLLLASTGFCR